MNREDFVMTLRASAGGVSLRLDHPRQVWPIVGVARRNGRRLFLALPGGYGVTLHRNGGVSFPGLPRSGGTSILWGAANERVRTLGRKHRAFHLGPVGVYVGRDF